MDNLIKRQINGHNILVDSYHPKRVYLERIDHDAINNNSPNILDIIDFLCEKDSIKPLYLKWELTNRCNMACPFCYIHNHTDSNGDIEFIDIKHQIDQMIENGLLYVLFTGGECTLHNDFLSIYKYLRRNGVLTEIYTNACDLNEKFFEVVSKYQPYKIEVSLYNDQIQNQRAKSNILKLVNLGIHVLCKTSVNTSTKSILDDNIEWANKYGIEHYYSTQIINAYDGTELNEFEIDIYTKARLERNKYSTKTIQSICQDSYIIPKSCFYCNSGRFCFYIDASFRLSACSQDSYKIPLLNKVFYDAYAELEKYITKIKGIVICKGCFAHSICKMCHIRAKINNDRNKTNQTPFIPDETYCKHTQRLFSLMFPEAFD